jgi:hypothetical protein
LSKGEDRITIALRERAQLVAAQEREAEEAVRKKEQLEALLAALPSVEPRYLVGLLSATWERMPADLHLIPWLSPSAKDPGPIFREVMAIGAAVADAFAVYAEAEHAQTRRETEKCPS